ncbi:MAG: GGDEF domain-containing protein [Lachnospiraceae bacterium]
MSLFDRLTTSALLIMMLTFFVGHLTRNLTEKYQKSIYGKILLGLMGGAFSVLLLFYSLPYHDAPSIIDLRGLVLITLSSWGGMVPVLITAMIQAALSMALYDLNIVTTHSVIQILLIMITFLLTDWRVKSEARRWYIKTFSIIIVTDLTYLLLIEHSIETNIVALQFSLIFLISSELQHTLVRSVREENELFFHYKRNSSEDFLTGLMNRQYFDTALKQSSQKALDSGEPLSCLMADLDYFKQVNDTFGHDAGDLVLKRVSSIMKDVLPKKTSIGRVGGEEFCMLLENCSLNNAYAIALNLNQAIGQLPIEISIGKEIHITISIGVAAYPESTRELNLLKEVADSALYDAKENGRNQVCQL